MPVHRRVTPSIKFAGTLLYTWVERGTVRVKCFSQEHNTMSPAKARTRTTRSGVERTNHEATASPTRKVINHHVKNVVSVDLKKLRRLLMRNDHFRSFTFTDLSYYAIDFLLVLMINHCARLKVYTFCFIVQRRNCSSVDAIEC